MIKTQPNQTKNKAIFRYVTKETDIIIEKIIPSDSKTLTDLLSQPTKLAPTKSTRLTESEKTLLRQT